MKPSGLRLLVVSSLLVGLAGAATRPQYGGTLHVASNAVPASLDPAEPTQRDSVSGRNISRLIFDTLVTLDERGRIQPALAASWQADPGNQRWQFWLRRGVQFDDSSVLNAESVAASLRTANRDWKIYAAGESIAIQLNFADPVLLAELALPKNSIVKRSPGKLSGTGPFHISDWQPGKKLTLLATEEYWGGRPFLDAIEVEFRMSPRDQMVGLELGKADVVEVAPEQVRHATTEGHRVATSPAAELMALVFTRERQSNEDGKLRDALALSIDRASIKNVLLEGEGDPAAAVLPHWMAGYEFLFPSEANLEKARQERVRQASPWTLGYDAADPLNRLIAERVALNARDAGIMLQPTSASNADLQLVRVWLPSLNAMVALTRVTSTLGLPELKFSGNSVEDLYRAESSLLHTQRIIPLFHLPVNYGLSAGVRGWQQELSGSWDLRDVWLSTEKP